MIHREKEVEAAAAAAAAPGPSSTGASQCACAQAWLCSFCIAVWRLLQVCGRRRLQSLPCCLGLNADGDLPGRAGGTWKHPHCAVAVTTTTTTTTSSSSGHGSHVPAMEAVLAAAVAERLKAESCVRGGGGGGGGGPWRRAVLTVFLTRRWSLASRCCCLCHWRASSPIA